MPTPIKTLLKHLGFSQKEADVYLASIRLGEAVIQEIARAAKLPRTTTSSILERLGQQGFVSARTERGKQVYWIEDPHILVEHEKARLEVFEQLSGRLHVEYHKSDKKPTAEVYDTKKGIIKLMANIIDGLKRGEEIMTFETPSAGHYQAVLPDEMFHAFSRVKIRKGVRTRSLIAGGQQEYVRTEALQHNVEVRILPKGLAMETSFWILGNSVVLFSGTHTFAVRINHRHTFESMRSLFEYFWTVSTHF